MEWESDSPCRSHTCSRKGRRSPGRCSSWDLEFRDCGATLERGLLLTADRWIEGKRGRKLWWEKPVEESWGAMEARWYQKTELPWWLSGNPPANMGDETLVQSPVQEDPTCLRAAKPRRHNYWAWALEPRNCNSWILSALEPMLCKKRGHHKESPGTSTGE